MDPLFRLETMLPDFASLFKYNNFKCFRTFIKDREIIEYLLDGLKPKQIAEEIGATAEAVQKRWERMLKWLQPIAQQLDELLDSLPPQEQKVMERYLDNQPIKEISEKLGLFPTDVETCVKRVIRQWKKTVTQKATTSTTTKVSRGS